MILFSALLVPVLASFIMFIFFKHKITWWEFVIPFAVSLIVALIFKLSIEASATSDTEFWNGTIVKGEYYEEWNEYIHKTCTEQYACGRDSKGNTTYCTRTYDCSYVDYHPPYWELTDDNGLTITVSKYLYERLVKKFGNNNFVELNRHYYTIDGNKYVSYWPKTDETIECMVTAHRYENRVQAARDVFNFPETDTADIRLYGLYNYPNIEYEYSQLNLLGNIQYKSYYDHKLEVLNAKLGKKKQVKVFVLLFNDKLREAGLKQEAYWKGGNKNELVVCIGLDKEKNVTWSHVFSWTENQIIKINIRNYIESSKKLNLGKTIDFIYDEVDKNFVRKHFKDFNYLTVDPTTSELIWTFVVTLIVNIIVVWWAIANEIE